MDLASVQDLYRSYVSSAHVDLLGSFGFGRTLASKAEGMYIYTTDGRKILDFTGGVGVLNHGHNNPRIVNARIEYQTQQRMEIHKNFLSQYVAGLSYNIAQLLPDDLKISYFCNSGAEAVEGAVKLAYKYHDGKRGHILHSDISFHGKLLGAAGITGSPELHYKFPTIPGVRSFEYNNIESVKGLITDLRRSNNESDVYAVVLEPFSASSLRECDLSFLRELREICSAEKILLIFDEVYTGWGKTGDLFSFMRHNVTPDIVTMSKSFGGGKASISCYTVREQFFRRAYDNLRDGTLHSTTFNGFGEECVTAIEAINEFVEKDYVGAARRIDSILGPGLASLQEKYPNLISEVRGRGALHGLLLAPALNATLPKALRLLPGGLLSDPQFPSKLITGSVISELFNVHGILTFFGSNREIPLIISPSLIATDSELEHFLDALDRTLSLGRSRLVLKFAKYKFLG